mmetsp:Transcript_16888/g.34989  ORF Transcript_16888/g.34989 Transcript_16888/m.34989 type:complete len:693 (-) Transcript_16888:1155-3233(-)
MEQEEVGSDAESVVVSDDEGGEELDDLDVAELERLGEESESSTDDDEVVNPVGDVPMKWYDGLEHLGYDREGRRIMRKARKERRVLARDAEHAWRVLVDERTGEEIELTDQELVVLDRIRRGGRARPQEWSGELGAGIEDRDSEVIAWSGTIVEGPTPLPQPTEPKRRFLPSKHEMQQVMKIVQAIRKGWIKIEPPSTPEEEEEERRKVYDLWEADATNNLSEMTKVERARELMKVAPPKAALPGHDESYNPPAEFLPTPDEVHEWNQNRHPEDRARNFLPNKYDSMRHVPGYKNFIRERFERCLDLYLAVRLRKQRINVDQASLLPRLPDPRDLRPFPVRLGCTYSSTSPPCVSVSIHAEGQWLVAGFADGIVRLIEIQSGRCFGTFFDSDDPNRTQAPASVSWMPKKHSFVFAACISSNIHLVSVSEEVQNDTREVSFEKQINAADETQDGEDWAWSILRKRPSGEVVELAVKHRRPAKGISWHHGGDYFVSICEDHSGSSAIVHRISQHKCQVPFRGKKASDLQAAEFHPTQPILVLATKRNIRLYDMTKQAMLKKLNPGFDWISSLAVHPSGDHIVVGSHDQRLAWFDLDLSSKPYKTIHNHSKAIRKVVFHPRLPLFADASDDGSIHVFHSMVYEDLMRDPLIVPVRVLDYLHKKEVSLGIHDICWHPTLPWLISCGADCKVLLIVE